MFHCESHSLPCHENDYEKTDLALEQETRFLFRTNDIINKSKICIPLQLDHIDDKGPLSPNSQLKPLKHKVGLYFLWIHADYCDDHKINAMMGVYVGKGIALKRLKEHIKKKWPQEESMYISFFECENRIAKYLEQLF